MACGKKGPPLLPFSDLPRPVRPLIATRLGQTMVIRFTVPNQNIDNRGPANLERVDLYMSPTRLLRSADYLEEERLVESVLVREPPPPPEDPEDGEDEADAPEEVVVVPEPPAPGVDQGAETTVVLNIDPAAFVDVPFEEAREDAEEEGGAPDETVMDLGPRITLLPGGGGPLMLPAPVRSLFFVASGVNRRGRQGPPSEIVEVPLYDAPPIPGAPLAIYDEMTMTVFWPPPARPRRPIQSNVLPYNVLAANPLPAPVRPPIQQPVPIGTNLPSNPLPRLPIRPIQSTTLLHQALAATPWASYVTATAYTLYEVEPTGQRLATGSPAPAPIHAGVLVPTAYAVPVVFGEERCFVVRTWEQHEMVTLESEPSPVSCVTPEDTFPPMAPRNLFLVGSEGAISLIWDPNSEADLAGYLVLRGAPADDTLQALTPEPILETTYRDTTVTSGVAYVYAVVAIDAVGNRSQESGRLEERGR